MEKRLIVWLMMLNLLGTSLTHAQSYPQYTVVINDTIAEGYFFIAPADAHGLIPSTNPFNMILDSLGRVVYYREFITGSTNNFNLQGNGMMSYSNAGHYYLMDSTFTVVDSVRTTIGIVFDSHDMYITGSGHYLLLGNENLTMDLSSYYLFNNNGSPGGLNANVKCGVIQELDAAKNVVFEWHAHDYYVFDDVDSTRLNNPNVVDWTHFNTIREDTDGNLLVSVRHFNEVTKIDHNTGAIIWRLGGKANQFNFLNDTMQFTGQHGINRISNGNITMLDNGHAGSPFNPTHPVTAKEYTLNETAHTVTLDWSYVNNPQSISSATGNVQRLTNGTTLVNYGFANSVNSIFDIITPAGQKSMQLFFNDTLNSYWAYNYSSLPWRLPRPGITCAQQNGQNYLVADSGYTSYQWSNGATTQSILLTSIGTYNVFVPIGNGGHISSDYLQVTDITNPCNLSTGISTHISSNTFNIYPNPFTDHLHLTKNILATNFELFNSSGKLIWSDCDLDKRDFSYLPDGIYVLKIHHENGSLTVEKLVKMKN